LRRRRWRRCHASAPDSDSDSVPHSDSDAYAHTDTQSNSDPDPDADPHSDADPHADADAHTDTDAHPNADTDTVAFVGLQHGRVSIVELLRRGRCDRGLRRGRDRQGSEDWDCGQRH
jgi:hypothetical protein